MWGGEQPTQRAARSGRIHRPTASRPRPQTALGQPGKGPWRREAAARFHVRPPPRPDMALACAVQTRQHGTARCALRWSFDDSVAAADRAGECHAADVAGTACRDETNAGSSVRIWGEVARQHRAGWRRCCPEGEGATGAAQGGMAERVERRRPSEVARFYGTVWRLC